MMRKVYKYPLEREDLSRLRLPEGATLLHVEELNNQFWLWALVDPAMPREERKIRIAGTGHDINYKDVGYINTFIMYGGKLVFHAFEVLEE